MPKKNSKKIGSNTKERKKRPRKYRKKDVPNLNYGVLHSLFGYPDGVSIVMKQIEGVMTSEMEIPSQNIHYLVGKSRFKNKNIEENSLFLDSQRGNKIAEKYFSDGYGGSISEQIEKEIRDAKKVIEDFVKKNKIDVIIAHNTSHPVNFILSVALSRFYRDSISKNKRTPKYVLWWHDSHLERDHFAKPANDVKRYLLQGIPGAFVEYIVFINSLQFGVAKKYFLELEELRKGFYNRISKNKDVVYNTTETFIESFKDLKKTKNNITQKFINDYKVEEKLESTGNNLKNTIFILQHTRIVRRKRIDFALKYCFDLQEKINKNRKKKKAIYFFISGHKVNDGSKKELIKLHKKLSKEKGVDNFFLEFAEGNYDKTELIFEDYPRIFASLGGIGTYFSEIEGFGNNLLEMLASGLIPIVYTYPVFKKDIEQFKFKLVSLEKFEVDDDSMDEVISLLKSSRKRKIWVNMNLEILKEYFAHRIISSKLTRAIIRKRGHI
jgi:hypothetical protein